MNVFSYRHSMKYIYRIFILTSFVILFFHESKAALNPTFAGSSREVLKIEPEKSTGLNAIYVVWNSDEIKRIELEGASSDTKASVYGNLGGGFAEEIAIKSSEGRYYLDYPEGDCGYILENGSERFYFWLIDYSRHRMELSGIAPSKDQNCEDTRFEISGRGDVINYYSINGRQFILDREIELGYERDVWNEEDNDFRRIEIKETIPSLRNVTVSPAINCRTAVKIKGDRFLKAWNIPQSADTYVDKPNGLSVKTFQSRIDGNGASIRKDNSDESAPLYCRFSAYVTEAVTHNEWQIANDPEFEDIDFSFIEQEIDFTFSEEGTKYVRFVGSNNGETCSVFGETYEITVGASELKIPNVFTPDGDGINDRWKVSSRSLLSFKCTIFDRNGREIYSFNNPSGEWDGSYKGKRAPTGVYFYVIEAIGADNKKYRKGGDINLIRKAQRGNGSNE